LWLLLWLFCLSHYHLRGLQDFIRWGAEECSRGRNWFWRPGGWSGRCGFDGQGIVVFQEDVTEQGTGALCLIGGLRGL
jgi:hypothetical protein